MKKYLFLFLALLPGIAFAQATNSNAGLGQSPQKFSDIVVVLLELLQYAVWILISLGVIYFLWGVLKFMGAGANEEQLQEGKRTVIYGILAIFVMVSVWGLVLVLVNTFFPQQPTLFDAGTPFEEQSRRFEFAS